MTLFQLSCPICAGLFQVDDSHAGAQVRCPHCANHVTVPALGGEAPPAPAPPVHAPPAPPPAPTPQDGANWFPPGYSQPETPAPNDNINSLLPPGAVENSAPHSPPSLGPATESVESLLPPGVTGDAARPEVRFEWPTHPTDVKTESSSSKPITTSIPASYANPSVNELLPPGAAPTSAASSAPLNSPSPAPSKAVDHLLPPGATPKANDASTNVAELQPAGPQDKSSRSGAAHQNETATGDGPVMIPTEDGGVVAIRKPVKTVHRRGEEIELRELSPEEKAKRRVWRNVVVVGFCVIVLIAATFILIAIR